MPQQVSRKERRKNERKEKKEKKQHNYLARRGKLNDDNQDGIQNQTESKQPNKSTNSKRKLSYDNEEQSKPVLKKPKTKTEQKTKTEVVKNQKKKAQPTLPKDPMIEAEERQIRQLEKKLGLKGKHGEKEKRKMYREFAHEGLGAEFGSFLDELDSLTERLQTNDMVEYEKKFKLQKPDSNRNLHIADDLGLDDFNDEDQDDIDFESDGENGDIDHNENHDVDDNESGDNDEEEDYKSDSISKKNKTFNNNSDSDGENAEFTYKPLPGQDIYGRQISETIEPSKSKYIPPHLRKNLEVNEKASTEKLEHLKRSVNGILNKVSESVLEPLSTQLITLYRSNSKNETNEILFSSLLSICVSDTQIRTTLIPPYVGVISALHHIIGVEVGGFFIERFTDSFLSALEIVHKHPSSLEESTHPQGKRAINFLLIICYLYNFSVVHHNLIFDIARRLIQHDSFMHDIDIEALLALFNCCGFQLRHDDPLYFKEIITLVQGFSSKVTEEEEKEEDGAVKKKHLSTRVKYMLNSMIEIKNNKKNQVQNEQQEQGKRIKKILSHLKSSNGGGTIGDACLRVSLDDIQNAETKGRWWKVGASWEGRKKVEDEEKIRIPLEDNEQTKKLLELATKQRMNTDVRRSIFCVILSSTNFEDAFEKLMELNLKNAQMREIIRVLIHCCGLEKAFNPYYVLLTNRLCEYDHKHRFTIQLTYWDTFKQIHEDSPRKIANLAKLLGQLIVSKTMSLSVLKPIEMNTLLPQMALFLKVLFNNLFFGANDAEFIAVFDRIGQAKEMAILKDSIAWFLEHQMPKIPSEPYQTPDAIDKYKKRMKAAKKCLNNLSVLDMLM